MHRYLEARGVLGTVGWWECDWQIALVSQEPVLFSGSIRDNIAYGLAECSLDEIQEAARKANAHDFIMKLEKGYDAGNLFLLLKRKAKNTSFVEINAGT